MPDSSDPLPDKILPAPAARTPPLPQAGSPAAAGLSIDHTVTEIGHDQQYHQRHNHRDRGKAGVERRPYPERPSATPYGRGERHNHPTADSHRNAASRAAMPHGRSGQTSKARRQGRVKSSTTATDAAPLRCAAEVYLRRAAAASGLQAAR